jgi:GH15 family glucan-1,4-alpha-glucosidase
VGRVRSVSGELAATVVNSATRGNSPIEDYAIIGDCRSAALVSRGGSVDWLCWPRFDSPSIFCGLVDPERGGFFSVRPRCASRVTRSYVGDSAVLRTIFHTDGGEFALTDAMPIASPLDAKSILSPEHEIVRMLTCTRGEGDVEVCFHPRTGFAQWNDKLRERGNLGIRIETRRGLLTLRSDLPLILTADRRGATAQRCLRAGESIHMSLTWTADAPAILPPLGEWTHGVIERTVRLWQEWSSRTRYDGKYRKEVIRSAIVVRLLSFAPSGAIVAAATSSLPEKRGGKNNWDYRYCWLRDAAFTVRGLLDLGHPEEAIGFTHWLLHATRLTQPRLKVLYDVFGRSPPPERTLPNLSGYEGASPVQTGNGADDQIQLDAYGEVIDAVWRVTRAGHRLDGVAARTVEGFGHYVRQHWTDLDAGIWEPRGDPQRHTHSLALCWTALDRLIDLQDHGDLRPDCRKLFVETRDQIRREIETRGFNEVMHSYTSTLDGEELDASTLLLGWYGFVEPGCARMRSSYAALCAELSPQPGLLFRNKAAEDDGAFGICCFWLAEHLARGGGTLQEARAAFEATLIFANDVGIFAEQIEPVTGSALGNVPQAFTHVGLINAALSLSEREKAQKEQPKRSDEVSS